MSGQVDSTKQGPGGPLISPKPVVRLSPFDQYADDKPAVIGLYGIPGCGKSFVLGHLKQELEPRDFELYEGSEKISALVPGGLGAFQELKEQDKAIWRGRAIDEIGKESARSRRGAIVAGHYMFWPEGDAAGHPVCTASDMITYTHIIYLAVDPVHVAQRRVDDALKSRPSESVEHLRKWQEAEIRDLRGLCRDHRILFFVLREQPAPHRRVSALVQLFRQDTAGRNLTRVEARLNESLPNRDRLQTVLVIDADKTLAAEDAGSLFWQAHAKSRPSAAEGSPLKELFGGPLGYSENAFRQATLLYEEAASDEEYEDLCEIAASWVEMHDDFRSLLQSVAGQDHVGAIVVTCGLRRVWERVLEREGLSQTVKVVGGGRISNGVVVTAAVKAAIVSHLRNTEHLHVFAFGDSPLDLPMLREANEAVIVVGDERTRSRSMDAALTNAIDEGGFCARQALLPDCVSPRLDHAKLPRVRLADQDFVNSVISRDPKGSGFRILHATHKKAAKLLMSPTRDASIAGPTLREAHRNVGRYLATEILSEVLGLEEYPILHVQGHHTSGHRLQHEGKTSIVALMRGGEPMAFGVNDVFPRAMFLHAVSASSVKPEHLENQRTVVLVDSVINTGKTLMQFIEHTRRLHPSIRIVVVAGVVQTEVVSDGHALATLMRRYDVHLVALRLSGNKFTGTGPTDTGNRLFQRYT